MTLNDTITLKGLKQDCYFIGKFNSGTFDQNDLNRIINKYYKQAQTAIRSINEDFYAVPTLAILSAGTNNQYSFPTDYEKIKFITLALSPTNVLLPLRTEYQVTTLITSDQVTNSAYVFQNPTAIIYGDYFEIASNVLATVTNGIRMVYIPLLVDMVNDTDTPNIFQDYQDVITWGALIDIAPRLNNDELLLRATQMFRQRLEDLRSYASARIENMAGSVVEGQPAEGGWHFPFGRALIP